MAVWQKKEDKVIEFLDPLNFKGVKFYVKTSSNITNLNIFFIIA